MSTTLYERKKASNLVISPTTGWSDSPKLCDRPINRHHCHKIGNIPTTWGGRIHPNFLVDLFAETPQL